MAGKKYPGDTIVRISKELENYFPPGSEEYRTTMTEWKRWLKWRPAERGPEAEVHPEYDNRFSIKFNDDTGDITFGKDISLGGVMKKRMEESKFGIIRNDMGKYLLTI